ncbi:hypothetical protein [Streptomyces olivochromogenes]|uniref:hypothetical protein n=1 Tax=Streptomyces olivochromogenes TaxID=1963 RepID=UPI001F3CEEA0|nr:hypothetical protein [Streptomyces olivochromogenes]
MPTPAIGETAWGFGELLRAQLPGTQVVRVTVEGDLTRAFAPVALAASEPGGGVVAVARDIHRPPSVAASLERLLRIRPDTVVVEMGLPPRAPATSHRVPGHPWIVPSLCSCRH